MVVKYSLSLWAWYSLLTRNPSGRLSVGSASASVVIADCCCDSSTTSSSTSRVSADSACESSTTSSSNPLPGNSRVVALENNDFGLSGWTSLCEFSGGAWTKSSGFRMKGSVEHVPSSWLSAIGEASTRGFGTTAPVSPGSLSVQRKTGEVDNALVDPGGPCACSITATLCWESSATEIAEDSICEAIRFERKAMKATLAGGSLRMTLGQNATKSNMEKPWKTMTHLSPSTTGRSVPLPSPTVLCTVWSVPARGKPEGGITAL